MLIKLFGGWGAALICAVSLAIGAGGIIVGVKSYCALRHFDEVIDILQKENAELRDTMSSKSAQPMTQELTFIVKDKTRSGKSTLAMQNRNYLNIKRLSSGEAWEGQIGVDRHGHVIFKDPAYSIRAGALILKAYERKHGINTVEKLVKRFSESNHEEYVSYICKKLKVKRNEKISLTKRLPELLVAMAAFETGMDVSEYTGLVATLE